MLIFNKFIIGEKILNIRKKRGLTREEVAERADISDRTYADIERGTVNMRAETMLGICKALGITPDDIFTEKDSPLNEDELLEKLRGCSPKEQETALALLSAYLRSL